MELDGRSLPRFPKRSRWLPSMQRDYIMWGWASGALTSWKHDGLWGIWNLSFPLGVNHLTQSSSILLFEEHEQETLFHGKVMSYWLGRVCLSLCAILKMSQMKASLNISFVSDKCDILAFIWFTILSTSSWFRISEKRKDILGVFMKSSLWGMRSHLYPFIKFLIYWQFSPSVGIS